jgi:hypothetical protein
MGETKGRVDYVLTMEQQRTGTHFSRTRFDLNKPCAAAIVPASESSGNDINNDGAAAREPARMEMIEEKKMFDYSGGLAPPTTAATEPVLGG